MEERLERLAKFIKALEYKGVFKFNINNFIHRLKLQKYVYLARKFGFDLGYEYNMYIHGPYSPDLARDYYALDIQSVTGREELKEEFIRLIKGASERWLELAASILMIHERYGHLDNDTLIKLVKSSKPHARREEILEILERIKKAKAI
jgi:uncharacterized protein YwgA